MKKFLKEVAQEIKHVVWPTRNETINYTILVIVVSVLVAYFMGAFDFIFQRIWGLL